MTILDTFYILFDSDASKLDKGIGETEKKTGSLLEKLKGVDKEGAKVGASLYDLIGKSAGLLGVGLSIGALIAGIKSTAAAYDELAKLAARFRSTAEAVDEFRDAAGLLGISEELSIGALKGLDTAIQDTFLGMGRAKKVFEELGITIKDGEGKIKPTTTVMGELAEKFKTMERGTQIRVMERLGLDPALLKLFNSDLIALQKRMAEVDKASGFNLDMAVKRSAEFVKATKGLTLEVNTLKLYLEKLAESFKIAAMPYFTEALAKASKYVKIFVDFLLKHSKFMEGVFVAIGGAILYFLVPAAIKGAIAVWAMIAPFLLIGVIVAGLAILFALLYDDIATFIAGGESMIGHVLTKWPKIAEVAKDIGVAFVALWDTLEALTTFLIAMWDDPKEAFLQFGNDLHNGLNKLLERFPELDKQVTAFSDAFFGAGETVVAVWEKVVGVISAAIEAIVNGISAVVGAVNSATSYLGIGGSTGEALSAGQRALGRAAGSTLGSQTSSSITNSKASKSTNVQIGKVEVRTQATDAEGISKAIGGSMQTQMRQAVNNFDDGVLA